MPGGLDALAADLRKAAREADSDARKTVYRGAKNIERMAKHLYSTYEDDGSAKHADKAISTTMVGSGGYYNAETGFDKNRKQGALGNLLEFNPNDQNYLETALDAERGPFEREMAKIGDIPA